MSTAAYAPKTQMLSGEPVKGKIDTPSTSPEEPEEDEEDELEEVGPDWEST